MTSIELWISVAIPVLLIVVGRVVGSTLERNHYRDIIEREARFRAQPAVSNKQLDRPGLVQSASLAVGSVVISVDHFKRFLSGFRIIFGGEIRSYSSLIDRARNAVKLLGEMKRPKEAQQAFLSWRNELVMMSGDLPAPVRGFVPKLVGYALRFAGVLYLMDVFSRDQEPESILNGYIRLSQIVIKL